MKRFGLPCNLLLNLSRIVCIVCYSDEKMSEISVSNSLNFFQTIFLIKIIQQYFQSRCSTGLQASGHGVAIMCLSDGTAPKIINK